MKPIIFIACAFMYTPVFATDSVDCNASPYSLNFIVSAEFGPQQFSLYKGESLVLRGEAKQLADFKIRWTNALGPNGNYLSFRQSRLGNVQISGTARGSGGHLLINGVRHTMECDWLK
jgi:hypothetical protein